MSSGSTFDYKEFHFTILSPRTCMIGINNKEIPNAPIVGNSYSNVLRIPEYAYDDSGNKYEVAETSQYCFRSCTNLVSAYLPKTLIRINEDTFYLTGITSLIIPRSVQILDFAAFSYMNKLEEIIFEPGSKLSKLGTSIFHKCEKIKKIVFPLYVSSIAGNIFSYIPTTINIKVYYCGMNKITDSIFGGGSVTTYVTDRYPSNTMFGGIMPTIINDDTSKQFIDYEQRKNGISCANLKHLDKSNIFILSIMITFI